MESFILSSTHDASGLMFIAAKQAAKRSRLAEGTLGCQNEAMVCIILCAITTEAAINEISRWYEHNHLRPPFRVKSKLPHGFEQLEIRTKYSLIPTLIRQKSFDYSSEPWQSFNVLIELRNFIVHLKYKPLPKSVIGMLRSKKLFDFGDTLGFNTCLWACNTVSDLLEELTNLIDPHPTIHHRGYGEGFIFLVAYQHQEINN
jgi:hypothetical protein